MLKGNNSNFRHELFSMGTCLQQALNIQQIMISKMNKEMECSQSIKRYNFEKMLNLENEYAVLKKMFMNFSEQCKNDWTSIYQQLLSIINNIVHLYQMKVDDLESKLMYSQERQEEMEGTISLLKEKSIDNQCVVYHENADEKSRHFYDSIHKSNVEIDACKKIKICDVIASFKFGGDQNEFNSEMVCYQSKKVTESIYDNSPPKTIPSVEIKHPISILYPNVQNSKSELF